MKWIDVRGKGWGTGGLGGKKGEFNLGHSTSGNPLYPLLWKEQGWEGQAGKDEKFFNKRSEKLWLRTWPFIKSTGKSAD